jgi:non-heme chloroperoxidase
MVHCTADNVPPIDATGRRFAKTMPSATYVEIDGAPRGMLWTHAPEVNKVPLDFLSS